MRRSYPTRLRFLCTYDCQSWQYALTVNAKLFISFAVNIILQAESVFVAAVHVYNTLLCNVSMQVELFFSPHLWYSFCKCEIWTTVFNRMTRHYLNYIFLHDYSTVGVLQNLNCTSSSIVRVPQGFKFFKSKPESLLAAALFFHREAAQSQSSQTMLKPQLHLIQHLLSVLHSTNAATELFQHLIQYHKLQHKGSYEDFFS